MSHACEDKDVTVGVYLQSQILLLASSRSTMVTIQSGRYRGWVGLLQVDSYSGSAMLKAGPTRHVDLHETLDTMSWLFYIFDLINIDGSG